MTLAVAFYFLSWVDKMFVACVTHLQRVRGHRFEAFAFTSDNVVEELWRRHVIAEGLLDAQGVPFGGSGKPLGSPGPRVPLGPPAGYVKQKLVLFELLELLNQKDFSANF